MSVKKKLYLGNCHFSTLDDDLMVDFLAFWREKLFESLFGQLSTRCERLSIATHELKKGIKNFLALQLLMLKIQL